VNDIKAADDAMETPNNPRRRLPGNPERENSVRAVRLEFREWNTLIRKIERIQKDQAGLRADYQTTLDLVWEVRRSQRLVLTTAVLASIFALLSLGLMFVLGNQLARSSTPPPALTPTPTAMPTTTPVPTDTLTPTPTATSTMTPSPTDTLTPTPAANIHDDAVANGCAYTDANCHVHDDAAANGYAYTDADRQTNPNLASTANSLGATQWQHISPWRDSMV